jgi:antitoxin MazE
LESCEQALVLLHAPTETHNRLRRGLIVERMGIPTLLSLVLSARGNEDAAVDGRDDGRSRHAHGKVGDCQSGCGEKGLYIRPLRRIFIVDTSHGRTDMIATIQKWGNSLAVRIPKAVAQDVRLRTGSSVDLTVRDGKLLVTPQRTRTYRLGQLLKQVSKRNLHGEIDTGQPVGKEAW